MNRWLWRLAWGITASAVLLTGLLVSSRPPTPAEAQGSGFWIRATCSSLSSPVANATLCLDTTTGVLNLWNGTRYVTITPLNADFGGAAGVDAAISMAKASGGAAVVPVLQLGSHLTLGPTGTITNTTIRGGGAAVIRLNAAGATLVGDPTITVDATLHAAASVIGDWPLLAESPPGQIEYTQVWRYGVGTPGNRMALLLTATAATLNLANADWLPPADFGNNFGGPMMAIGRNANGGAEGPAAGSLMLTQADNTRRYLWFDASGLLRSHTAPPTGSSGTPSVADTAGHYAGALAATTGSIGGAALLPGECSGATVGVTGAATTMVAVASPNTHPGYGVYWIATVSSTNNVTVSVCSVVAVTPAAGTYNVRVLP
ncbi:MAG TPA: hypothetical protein DCQ64_18735 [Candidatus Rokubacteria bacterium]|nr:hypothetical protein [Candidatus Rokubacteria bacterium]